MPLQRLDQPDGDRSAMAADVYLLVQAPTRRTVVPLDDGPITIGRHRGNVLPLIDDRVSRYHCVVERTGEVVRVTDLGSRNGTKINGERLTSSADFRSGDVVQVGNTVLRLTDQPDDHPALRPGKGNGAVGSN